MQASALKVAFLLLALLLHGPAVPLGEGQVRPKPSQPLEALCVWQSCLGRNLRVSRGISLAGWFQLLQSLTTLTSQYG